MTFMGQAPTLCVSPSPTSVYYYFLVDSQSYPQKTMCFLLINRAFGALGRLVSGAFDAMRSAPLLNSLDGLVGWWPEFTSFVEYVGGWNPKLNSFMEQAFRLDFTFLWNPLNRSRQKIPCALKFTDWIIFSEKTQTWALWDPNGTDWAQNSL